MVSPRPPVDEVDVVDEPAILVDELEGRVVSATGTYEKVGVVMETRRSDVSIYKLIVSYEMGVWRTWSVGRKGPVIRRKSIPVSS